TAPQDPVVSGTSAGGPDPRRGLRLLALFCLLPAAALGCGRGKEQAPQTKPPVVPVSRPVPRVVTDYVEYTARTDAVNSVAVRPRVTGYLVKTPFTEGAEVKTGDLLFEVDPRPY